MVSSISFPLFSSLPVELRFHIWQLSCHSRVVEVTYDPETDLCTSTTSVPAVLHACRESRSEASRIYKLSFDTKTQKPRIYFCSELDTLYIPRPPSMGYDDASRSFTILVGDAESVANLAIDYVPPTIKRPWETYNKYILMKSFPRVHEVLLVIDDAASLPGSYGGRSNGCDLGFKDTVQDPSSVSRLLDGVKAAFFYEVGGYLGIDDKGDVILEPLNLPSLVLKVKTWKSKEDTKGVL
ncbi:hypothetical protein GGS20DRAFT_10160 [Poronia punctata]|nr:hypothetical protein GGS20DRAFT_10160 [Poronia punctata]